MSDLDPWVIILKEIQLSLIKAQIYPKSNGWMLIWLNHGQTQVNYCQTWENCFKI